MKPESVTSSKARAVAYIAGFLATFLIVAALVLVMYRMTRPAPLGANRAAERYKNLRAVQSADAEGLTAYAWDPAKGIGRIPLEQAMKLTIEEWKDPAAARSNLIARVDKATAPPPKPPEKPSEYE